MVYKVNVTAENGKNTVQIAAIVIGSMSSMISCMVIAWSSPYMTKIAADTENYNISQNQASVFPIMNTVGAIVFLPFTPMLPNRIGRKPTLLLSTIPYSMCWIIKLFCKNFYAICFARLLGGLGDALLLSSLPLYIGEVATPEVRGVWGNGLIVVGYFGIFLMNVLGAYLTIPQTSIVCLVLSIIFAVSFWLMPESPYYYIMKEKEEEAKLALRKLRHKKNVEEEFVTLKMDIQRQMSESGTLKDLFLIKSNRRALIAGLFLRISQMLSGLFVFASYTHFIFDKAGGHVDPSLSAIIYTGLAFILYVLASVFAEKLGRKKSLIISLCLTSIVLFLEGFYFYIDEYHKDFNLSDMEWFPLTGMLVYLLFSSFGIGIIPTLMLSELYSASIKARAISIVSIAYALSYVIMNTVFYQLTNRLGLCAPFFLFSVCNIVSSVLVAFLVPETKGKTLEEIQLDLKSK